MPTESWYKTDLVGKLKKAGCYARRVEDQFAVGTLDMIFVIPNMPTLFAEGKVIKHMFIEPSERQWIEGTRIMSASNGLNALPMLVGWKYGVLHVASWARKRFIHECTIAEPGDTPLDTISRWFEKWRTTEI